MTDSDQLQRPPDAPPDGPEWKKLPGAKDYEFSHRGRARSLPRTKNGRDWPGVELKLRRDGDGYLVVNVTMDDGTRKCGVSVARCVLLAHAGEPPDPGMQACHGPGGQLDNRWPENLRWDTDEANRADWRRDNPPRPKPLKRCVRCSAEFDGKGQRCHPCVEQIGTLGADLLAHGLDLEVAAAQLAYPSAVGLFRLAVRYGNLRCYVLREVQDEVQPAWTAIAARHSRSRLRRVLFRREASRQDSDAQ